MIVAEGNYNARLVELLLSGKGKDDIIKLLSGGQMAAVSDLFSGLSGGNLYEDYAHSPKYWNRDVTLFEKEAFANFM